MYNNPINWHQQQCRPAPPHNLTSRVFRLISLITKQWEATQMQMEGLGFPGHPT